VWRLTPAGRAAVKAHQPVTFRMLVRGGLAEAAVHATIRFAIAT